MENPFFRRLSTIVVIVVATFVLILIVRSLGIDDAPVVNAPIVNNSEDQTNEEKDNLIKVSSPQKNSVIKSPVIITGEARGYWFFEASFPIEVKDSNGEIIGSGIATAQEEWMTEDFVPFTANISFTPPQTATGFIVLKKDNPSGDPIRDDSLVLPVSF